MNFLRKLVSFLFGRSNPPVKPPLPFEMKDPNSFGEKLTPGDIVVFQLKGGQCQGMWGVNKVLAVDQYPSVSSTIHCLTFHPQKSKPMPECVAGLPVLIWHSPMSATGFEAAAEVLCHEEVLDKEKMGFIDFLKRTNLIRYCEVTGQDLSTLIKKAMEHYNNANELCEQGQKEAGIQEYERAVELYPTYFEAIDNMAFTYMELGDYQSALDSFEESLQANPDGSAAFFSKGECLLRLGKIEDAIAALKQSSIRFPSTKSMCDRLLNVAENIRRGGT